MNVDKVWLTSRGLRMVEIRGWGGGDVEIAKMWLGRNTLSLASMKEYFFRKK